MVALRLILLLLAAVMAIFALMQASSNQAVAGVLVLGAFVLFVASRYVAYRMEEVEASQSND